MLAAILVFVFALYLIGLRADRVQAIRQAHICETECSRRVASSGVTDGPRLSSPQSSDTAALPPSVSRARFNAMRHLAYIRGVRAKRAERKLRVRWAPTVQYALTLAAAVTGVPRSDLATVSHCESTWNPFAKNGRQLGIFQLGWRPFGLDPYDPIANALSAAMTVVHDGGWRQWVCKP